MWDKLPILIVLGIGVRPSLHRTCGPPVDAKPALGPVWFPAAALSGPRRAPAAPASMGRFS